MANFLLSKKRFHALKIERISISRLLLPFSDYDSHVLYLEKKFIMHKFNRLLTLSLPLLLISCAPASEDSASVSLSSSEPSASSSTESTSEDYSKWTEDQKILMKNYADGVLPYPSGFKGEVTFDVATDEASDSVFLQILCKAEEFGIASYYESLVKDGWSVIRDYNGNPEQSDSKGNVYYELTKIDGEFGYVITYFHYVGESTSYDVIQCYNDFDTELDSRTSWTEEEKAKFKAATTEVPPFMKLGERNAVVSDGSSYAYCLDMLAKDLSKENAEILMNNGYVLDEETSKSHGNYVLVKTFEDGSTIYASTYYYSGNYVTFSYGPKIYESSSWLSELTSEFEAKTGYSVPHFEANKYYGYVKDGITTIYCYTENFYIETQYEKALLQSGIIYDNTQNFYADWAETYYVEPFSYFDNDGNTVFGINFASIDSPYDTIETGWPKDKINKFLEDNSISGKVPEFDFSSLSPYATCHTSVSNYEEAYAEAYAAVKANPSSYYVDPDDEEAIVEKAKSLAKANTAYTIRIYDPEVRIDDMYTEFKVNDAFFDLCKKAGMTRVESSVYDIAMEDENGLITIGIDLNHQEVTIINITYGSSQSHDPVFRFDEESVTLTPGSIYSLRYTCEGYPYDVTFSSDNSKVSVDSKGRVTIAEDAEDGTVAIITASMEIPNEGTKSITCKILVAKNYTDETAIKAVASLYNDYYSFGADDAQAAKPTQTIDSDVDEGTVTSYWSFFAYPSFKTISDAKSFVMDHLIPSGFLATEDWPQGSFEDGTTNYSIAYSMSDSDYNGITLVFVLFYDPIDGSLILKVVSAMN